MKNNPMRHFDLIAASIWFGLMVALIWMSAINSLLGIYDFPLEMIKDHVVISTVCLAWFISGAHKGLLLLAWQKKEFFSFNLKPLLQVLMLMPFIPLIPFKAEWYRLPERVSGED